ncbi:DUF4055 domain-containing protein [Synechococcus sp.]|uniref:DUF4055 domain-containing protein n=1 Tax=Synechococcus sp. TaxID=1131 RepID=UPI0034A28203
MHDCWDLLNNQKEYYLPRGEREPDSAYKRRIDAALPSGFFRDALRTFAGMLTASHWRELPPSLQAVVSDVDGLGTDLGVFLERADLLVLRDGACLIAVTAPEHLWPSAGDYAQALRLGDRASLPKLQLIERADLLNWGHSPESTSGANTLPTQLIYRSTARPAGACPSGAQYVSVISGVDGLTATTSELVEDPSVPGGYALRQVSSSNYQNINSLPMIWYASDGAAFGEGDLPHLGLAHQYLNHFRCQSDYQELLYRTAMPVGVRTGVISNAPLSLGAGAANAEIVLGPNSIIDLPEGASFQFVEIQARSLAEHRAWLELLDQGMRRDALIPSGAQGAPRTATEISMAASQAYALLQSQAIQKASMFSSLLSHWTSITGESSQTIGFQMGSATAAAMVVEISPMAPAPKPSPTVAEMLQLHEKGIISEQALRQWLGDIAGIAPTSV